jgi:hypothetical protein
VLVMLATKVLIAQEESARARYLNRVLTILLLPLGLGFAALLINRVIAIITGQ